MSGHAVVLNRRQRLKNDRRDLGSEIVLDFPFQLHPSVLKPGPHLRQEKNKNSSVSIRSTAQFGDVCVFMNPNVNKEFAGASHLSFCEVQLLCRLLSLPCVQIFLLDEYPFQFLDLLGRKLCAHSALGSSVFSPLVPLIHGESIRGNRVALIPAEVLADVTN